MLQTVRRLPIIAEPRVPSQAGPLEICSGQNGTRTGFSTDCVCCSVPVRMLFRSSTYVVPCQYVCSVPVRMLFRASTYVVPCQYHSTCVPYHSHHQHVSFTGISGRNLGTYQKAAMLRKLESVGWSRCFSSLKGQSILFPGGWSSDIWL
jgi:hypothetical protein